MKYEVKETPEFSEEIKVIPGLGANNALLRFAFDNSIGDISKTFKVPAGYVVAQLIEVLPKTTKPLKDVSESIKRIVLREKKIERTLNIAKEIKEKISTTNELSVAKTVYEKAKVSSANSFTASGTIPGIGRDFAFSQAALQAELNTITGPVKSNRGSYLLKVTSRSEIDSTIYNVQKNSLRDNLLRQKRNRVYSDWVTSLKENADIEDNRYEFYR